MIVLSDRLGDRQGFAEWKVAAANLHSVSENCDLNSESRSVAEADESERACQEELKIALQAHKIRKEVQRSYPGTTTKHHHG